MLALATVQDLGNQRTFFVTFCPFFEPLAPPPPAVGRFYIEYLAYCSVLEQSNAHPSGQQSGVHTVPATILRVCERKEVDILRRECGY